MPDQLLFELLDKIVLLSFPSYPCFFECFRYVHNNIFFSFAVDSDYEHIPKDRKPDCQNGSSRSTKVTSSGVERKCDMNHAETTEVSNSVSDNSLDASAEAQIADSEQATYASANNDLKGTKAYQEADISGLYNLAMAIIDYRGHRVVAQVCVVNIFLVYSSFRIFCCFDHGFCHLFFRW
jgi:protein TIF31